MTQLLESSGFWLLVLTILAFFIGVCFLNSLYESFNITWGNVSVADVLIKAFPSLGVLLIIVIYVVTAPHSPLSRDMAAFKEASPQAVLRELIPLTALLAFTAILLGKFYAWRLRHSSIRLEVHTDKQIWHNVIAIAFGNDFLSCFDPKSNTTVMLPWSAIRLIKSTPKSETWLSWLWDRIAAKGRR